MAYALGRAHEQGEYDDKFISPRSDRIESLGIYRDIRDDMSRGAEYFFRAAGTPSHVARELYRSTGESDVEQDLSNPWRAEKLMKADPLLEEAEVTMTTTTAGLWGGMATSIYLTPVAVMGSLAALGQYMKDAEFEQRQDNLRNTYQEITEEHAEKRIDPTEDPL